MIKDFVKMSPVSEFCIKRGIPHLMRDAFNAYVHGTISDRFLMKDTDTLTLLISRLSQERIGEIWIEFIQDVRKILPSQ